MLSPVLVLAEVAAHANAPAPSLWEQLIQLKDAFGLNLPSFIAQVLNFCIFAWLLWRFAFKPVLATINERQQTIASGLKYAEEMKAKLAAAQQESGEIIRKAQRDANRVVDEARRTAKEFLDKQMVEATAKANETLVKAQQAIELEHRKMLADARSEIARLVVDTTERVLARRLTDSDRAAYNDLAGRELAEARH